MSVWNAHFWANAASNTKRRYIVINQALTFSDWKQMLFLTPWSSGATGTLRSHPCSLDMETETSLWMFSGPGVSQSQIWFEPPGCWWKCLHFKVTPVSWLVTPPENDWFATRKTIEAANLYLFQKFSTTKPDIHQKQIQRLFLDHSRSHQKILVTTSFKMRSCFNSSWTRVSIFSWLKTYQRSFAYFDFSWAY